MWNVAIYEKNIHPRLMELAAEVNDGWREIARPPHLRVPLSASPSAVIHAQAGLRLRDTRPTDSFSSCASGLGSDIGEIHRGFKLIAGVSRGSKRSADKQPSIGGWGGELL